MITEAEGTSFRGDFNEYLFVRHDGRVGFLRHYGPHDWRIILPQSRTYQPAQVGEAFENGAIARLELIRLMTEMA